MNADYNGRSLWNYSHTAEALDAMEPYHANAPQYKNYVASLMDDAYEKLQGSGTLNSDTAFNSLIKYYWSNERMD